MHSERAVPRLSVMGTCNNGHEFYEAIPPGSFPPIFKMFTGPDPVEDFFGDNPLASIDDINLNSSGDFTYVIGAHNGGYEGEIFEASDLTTETPEPSSIFLLSTGLFAFAGTLRRRLF